MQTRRCKKTNFVMAAFLLLTQNLNPTGLDRKLEIPLERDYIKMIWGSCVQHKYSKFIYQKKLFLSLASCMLYIKKQTISF